ncbi:MAG: histidine kinase dimerization/phospho-acceptor domain-containing protein [Sphingomicrobium sp.]
MEDHRQRMRGGPSVSLAGDAHRAGRKSVPAETAWRPLIDPLRRLTLFTAAVAITSLPFFSPFIGGTAIRLIWVPLALVCFAFTWFPRREAPLYALIYATMTLAHEQHGNLMFDATFVLLDIAQAFALAILVPRHLTRKQLILQPVRVMGYIAAALLITFIGASVALMAALGFEWSAAGFGEELGGNALLAWRYWWLGHACAFTAITGTLTFLRQVNRADWAEVLGPPGERRLFLISTVVQLAATMMVLPVFDMTSVGLPPDLRLGLLFIPVMTAIIMTIRFRGFGASIAILTIGPIAIQSIGGPFAAQNWAGLPPMASPIHLILIVIPSVCWPMASTLRHLQWAIRDAEDASLTKSRLIAMLNHELRTPLNAILGFSELMRLQNFKEMGEAVGSVENIHASGQRLLAMIEGLLGRADQGASVFDLTKQSVHIEPALAEVVADLQQELKELGCGLLLSVEDELAVDADPRALKRMLHVLLTYPLRFVGPDTVISVSARNLGTDTIVEVNSQSLINAVADDRDTLEVQLVNALALAHGARLHIAQCGRSGRVARLTFFATRAAA